MNLKLYTLADDYVSALERLPESGLDEQTIADTMEGLEGALVVKAQNVAAYILNLEAEAEAVDRAAKAMAERAKILRSRFDGLKNYLHQNMVRTSITEIKAIDGTFRLTLRDNPPSVEIIDADFIPDHFKRVIPETTEPDKQAIRDAFKRGETVPGAMLRKTTRLEIKS